MAKNVVKAIQLSSIDSATFTGSYQAINSSGISNACFALAIINNSNVDITMSLDGVTDHDFIPDNSTRAISSQQDAIPNNNVALFKKGQVIYVKGAAGIGSVYVAGYYVEN